MAMLNNQRVNMSQHLNVVIFGVNPMVHPSGDGSNTVKSQEPYNGGITFTACPPGKRRGTIQ